MIKNNRINVDNILCCSAGGLSAIFFTLGVIRQLLHNNKFINNFDIISASSGSVITIILIEMCYDNNLITEENWFEKYVVKTIHDFFNTNYIMSIFKLMYLDYNNVSLIHKFWTTLGTFYNKIPKIEKSSKSKNIKKPIFCYNYFNTDTLKLSYDNSDLNNDINRIEKIIMRCGLPMSNINNISSIDSALKNMFATNILDDYYSKNITICSKINYYQDLLEIKNLLYRKSYIISLDYTKKLLKNTNVSIITISCSKYPSLNKYHNKLFMEFEKQFQSYISIYYMSCDILKIFENEGYIQCNTILKMKQKENNIKNKILFKIPNKSVYKKAKKIMYEFEKT